MTEEQTRKIPKLGGGPHGLGDPNDTFLRKTESDILIPKRVREISRREYCKEQIESYIQCCRDHPFAFFLSCREENKKQIKCLEKMFYDEDLRKRATQEYLAERSEYRRTGIKKKDREESAPRTFY